MVPTQFQLEEKRDVKSMENTLSVQRDTNASRENRGALNVFPLWKQDIRDTISTLSPRDKAETENNILGIAAVLPDQQLSLETLDSLESAGLLVMEVPASFEDKDPASITEYLEQQLEEVKETTLTGPPSIFSADASPDTSVNGSLNADQQRILLRSLNDPDKAVDSFW